MNFRYSETVHKLSNDHKGRARVENEKAKLRSEAWKLKSVLEKTLVPPFSLGLIPLKFYLLNQLRL